VPFDPTQLDAWMELALEEARLAPAHGDIPIGAVVIDIASDAVVARRHNERERVTDPTAHAEVLALRDAAARGGDWRLSQHVLVATVEPCPMCAGAAWAARVPTIVFGAADPNAGATGTLYNFAADPRLNHAATVIGGVRGEECAAVLKTFFESRR